MSEKMKREIMVWNDQSHTWDKGYRNDVVALPKVTSLAWDATGVATDVKPKEDKIIDVERATSISVQADTTNAGNTSTDIDINVLALLEGEIWDNVPYAEMNLGDAEIKTMLVNVGIKKIKLRVDNNEAATEGYVRAIVKVRE